MGTNYYRTDESSRIHLGKSSGGWKFLLQANNYKCYRDWDGMQEWLRKDKATIINEYGDPLSVDEFVALVESKQSEPHSHVHYGGDRIAGYDFNNVEFS